MEQDEKMIESMNLYKKGTSGNIEDGFCIKEKMYYFKRIFSKSYTSNVTRGFCRFTRGYQANEIPK